MFKDVIFVLLKKKVQKMQSLRIDSNRIELPPIPQGCPHPRPQSTYASPQSFTPPRGFIGPRVEATNGANALGKRWELILPTHLYRIEGSMRVIFDGKQEEGRDNSIYFLCIFHCSLPSLIDFPSF